VKKAEAISLSAKLRQYWFSCHLVNTFTKQTVAPSYFLALSSMAYWRQA
jgi:hypothetical protein